MRIMCIVRNFFLRAKWKRTDRVRVLACIPPSPHGTGCNSTISRCRRDRVYVRCGSVAGRWSADRHVSDVTAPGIPSLSPSNPEPRTPDPLRVPTTVSSPDTSDRARRVFEKHGKPNFRCAKTARLTSMTRKKDPHNNSSASDWKRYMFIVHAPARRRGDNGITFGRIKNVKIKSLCPFKTFSSAFDFLFVICASVLRQILRLCFNIV